MNSSTGEWGPVRYQSLNPFNLSPDYNLKSSYLPYQGTDCYQRYISVKYVGETAYLVWLINKRTLGTNKPEYIETGLTIRKKSLEFVLCFNGGVPGQGTGLGWLFPGTFYAIKQAETWGLAF